MNRLLCSFLFISFFVTLVCCNTFGVNQLLENSEVNISTTSQINRTHTCGKIEVLDCNWYLNCFEPQWACGPDGYVVSYGFHYCEQFREINQFTAAGEKWRHKTTLCLQNSLAEFRALPDDINTCESIKHYAFESHLRCYMEEPSVCHLPAADLVHILRVISPGIFDPDGLPQFWKGLNYCIAELFHQWWTNS